MARHKLFDSLQSAMDQIPLGHKIKVQIDQINLCIAHHNGRIYAIKNACPHLGESLVNGTVNHLGEIVCPWHAYRFDLKTGQEASNRCRDATTYRLITGEPEEAVYIEV